MTKHICVLMGGQSSEREVSISSGTAVVDTLKKAGYHVTSLDPDHDIAQRLCELKPDVVFNALHGTYGEDGCIPGLLNYLKIPYTHSGVFSSAVAMDKNTTKLIASSLGIRCPKGNILSKEQCLSTQHEYPVVIKPNSDGSSVGVYIVHSEKDLPKTLEESDSYLVEQYVPGKELSVAVCDGKALGVMELQSKSEFFDYTAKYTAGQTQHIYPADIPEDIYQLALDSALKIHQRLGCRSISRSDFRYNPETNQLFFLEINTHPGLTAISILPEIASYHNMSFSDVLELLIEQAQCEK